MQRALLQVQEGSSWLSEEEREAILAAYAHDYEEIPQVTTVEEAIKQVHTQVENGADSIKIMIEEGTVIGAVGLSVLYVSARQYGEQLSIKSLWFNGSQQLC
jgi:DNA-directed RNA polymerase subunit H (RpoH/RPB5)